MITINQLVDLVADIAGKRVSKKYISGPTGVRGRNSDNSLIAERLGWKPSAPLIAGLEKTYAWIERQVRRNAAFPPQFDSAPDSHRCTNLAGR